MWPLNTHYKSGDTWKKSKFPTAAEVPTLPQHGLPKNQPTCQASASLCLQALTRKCVMWELLHIHPQLKRENPPGTSTAKWDNLMVTISQHETAFGLTDQWWHWNGQRTAGRKSKAGFLSMRVTLLWGVKHPSSTSCSCIWLYEDKSLSFTWNILGSNPATLNMCKRPHTPQHVQIQKFCSSMQAPGKKQHHLLLFSIQRHKNQLEKKPREKYHNLQLWGLRADLCLQPGKWADLKLSFTNKYSLITCGPSALGVRQQQPS